jgi:hypothetical protein
MVPIGMALAWGGYTLALWGYCLVRGYNVPFMGLFKNVWPGKTPAGKTAAQALQKLGSTPVPQVP